MIFFYLIVVFSSTDVRICPLVLYQLNLWLYFYKSVNHQQLFMLWGVFSAEFLPLHRLAENK